MMKMVSCFSVHAAVLLGGGSCDGGFAAPSVCPAGGRNAAAPRVQPEPHTPWTADPGSAPAFSLHSLLPGATHGLQGQRTYGRVSHHHVPLKQFDYELVAELGGPCPDLKRKVWIKVFISADMSWLTMIKFDNHLHYSMLNIYCFQLFNCKEYLLVSISYYESN